MEIYKIDPGILQWAVKRNLTLTAAELPLRCACESLKNAIQFLRITADGLDDYPESDRIRSIITSMEAVDYDLDREIKDCADDNLAIAEGLKRYEMEVRKNVAGG